MTKPNPDHTIDRLLQDRAQFVNWLTRLNSGGDNQPVPEAVRSRVRADYERRLEAVLEELRGHTNTLDEQVAGLTGRHRELTAREGEYKEQLSEAEVRHMVGEYDESKWEGIQAELMKVVNQIRGELTSTAGEITRLTDVLNTIRTPIIPETIPAEPEPEPEPEPVPPPPLPSFGNSAQRPLSGSGPRAAVIPEAPRPEPITPPPAPMEPVRPAASAPPPPAAEIPFRPAAPRPVPPKPTTPPRKEDVPGRTLWFPSGKPEQAGQSGGGKLDELAFLKSVTGEAAPVAPAPAPAPRRPSGGFTKPAAMEPPAPPPPPVEEARPVSSPTQDSVKDRQSGQKTLKCGECGTLNRPTEWYCERCGAELAAL